MKASRRLIADLAELSKWKLSLAVSFSAVTGFLLLPSETYGGALLTAAGVFFLSAGASALNQYTERNSDAVMARTADRPLPSGRMRPSAAMLASVTLLASGCLLLAGTGVMPVLLGAVNILLYNFVYTGLKKRTTLAIVPGALVGALPPLIGYTAAGGLITETRILLFALFMFLWQMPHFWLLLLRFGEEYEKAGIKTLHRVLSHKTIVRLVLAWITGSSILLWVLTAIFRPIGPTASALLLVLNTIFILAFAGIIRDGSLQPRSKLAFIALNSFPAMVMLILIFLG
jgi:protoheme IX farnesyltransferase